MQLMLPLQMPLALGVSFLHRPLPPPVVEAPPPRTIDAEQSNLF